MHSEVIDFLRLNDVSDRIFIFVTKDVSSDINFIYGEILSHYIKNNYGVIVLNFAQSFAHYNHLLLKCGVNVRQLRECLDFIIIDGLCEIEKLASDSNTTYLEEQNPPFSLFSMFSALFKGSPEPDCIKKLYKYLSRYMQNFLDKSKPFVLLIDDISVMLNLGLNMKIINALVHYCRFKCMSNFPQCSNVLLVGCTRESSDQENMRLANYFNHLALIKLQIEGLETGYSKDAHGKITFSSRNLTDHSKCDGKMLFKITEKGAKLLTLGL